MKLVSTESLGLPESVKQLPRPDMDGEWKPFWDATRRGELLIQRCKACGRYQFYPRYACGKCAGEPEWVAARGDGSVHTYSVVGKSLLMPFKEMAPYVLAVVDLPEGVRMMTNIAGCAPGSVKIGMSVKAVIARIDDDYCLPYWVPADKTFAD